jgi:hypothetical protein
VNLVPPPGNQPQNPTPGEPGPGTKDDAFYPRAADHDMEYTFGRAAKAARSMLDDWQWSRLLLLKIKHQNRIIDAHIQPEDPDGLCL